MTLEACLGQRITLVVRDIGPFIDCNIGFTDEKSRTVSARLAGVEPEVGLWVEPEQAGEGGATPGPGWRVLVQWRDVLLVLQTTGSGSPALSRLPDKPIGFRARG